MSLIPFALVSGIDLNSLFSLATYALFFVFILYGQRIQYYVTLGNISRSLNRLKVMEDGAKKEALDYITQGRGDKEEITERVNGVLEYVTIMPESVCMQPARLHSQTNCTCSSSPSRRYCPPSSSIRSLTARKAASFLARRSSMVDIPANYCPRGAAAAGATRRPRHSFGGDDAVAARGRRRPWNL